MISVNNPVTYAANDESLKKMVIVYFFCKTVYLKDI